VRRDRTGTCGAAADDGLSASPTVIRLSHAVGMLKRQPDPPSDRAELLRRINAFAS
jgi:hypothetical protein